ncbi:putative ATP-dependent RNA helicase [Sarcoptes scabiei]|nr:putative ATP-dependent RNA helicase [Sarcoptes scabiei]
MATDMLTNGYHQSNQIESFFDQVINSETLDQCFAGFTKVSSKLVVSNRETFKAKLIEMLKGLPSGSVENSIKNFVHRLSFVYNNQQSDLFFTLLEDVIEAELVKPMIICQLILGDNLILENEIFWVNGLSFIRRTIHLIKYKEVRDVLAILLSKISLIPVKSSKPIRPQIFSYYQLIELIVDRDASLLPAYLVLDEIQNKFFTPNPNGHWMFSRLISQFVDSFRPIAKIVSHSGRPRITPIIGYCFLINSLKLDDKTAKYKLNSLLPYDKEVNEPQSILLLNIIEQTNSRETIANILSLNKAKEIRGTKNLNIIEKLLAELIVNTILKSCQYEEFFNNDSFESLDFENSESNISQMILLWNHISTTALHFTSLFQNVCVPVFLNGLHEKIFNSSQFTSTELFKCRELILWILLQIISAIPTSTNANEILPNQNELLFTVCMKFIRLLYTEKEPLSLPDFKKRNSVYIMAPASIIIFLSGNDLETSKVLRNVPIALRSLVEYLRSDAHNNPSNDYSVAILLNSYRNNSEIHDQIYHYFIDNIVESRNMNHPTDSSSSLNSTIVNKTPVSLDFLDSLTIQTRKNLNNYIMSTFLNIIQNKSLSYFPSYLTETFCRLTSFNEIELNEAKSLSQLMNTILRNQGSNFLYNLLELCSHRLHRINCANQIQLLRQLFNKSYISQINHTQLYSFMENTALKILYGFNCFELIAFCSFQPKIVADTYNFLPPDSEELYKIFVYTLARAIHITGTETLSSEKYISWINEILKEIKNLNTNLTWPSFTLQCFPTIISEFFQLANKKDPGHQQLKKTVDDEYCRWKSLTNEEDIIKYYTTPGNPPVIYCLLYRMLTENDTIPPVSYKILDKIGIKALSSHLRTFADFIVLDFANLVAGNVTKCREAVNDLVWKYHIFTIDKLLLCLSLRSFEGREAQVCFFIIQSLVLDNADIKNRIQDFVKENSPLYWRHSDLSESQNKFHQKYPEKYYFNHLDDGSHTNQNDCVNIPSIFSNICLRMLPVFG